MTDPEMVAIEVEACELNDLPPPSHYVNWWQVGNSKLSSKCPILHIQGKRNEVQEFLMNHGWVDDLESWGVATWGQFFEKMAVAYEEPPSPLPKELAFVPPAGEVPTRAYVITASPAKPSKRPLGYVQEARDPLEALDRFCVHEGFGSYTDIIGGGLEEGSLGVDEYGLWATYSNMTIWAIPLDPLPPIETVYFEGLAISLSRNTITRQLIVHINTEGVNEKDEDDDGASYLQISLNDVELYDYERGGR